MITTSSGSVERERTRGRLREREVNDRAIIATTDPRLYAETNRISVPS